MLNDIGVLIYDNYQNGSSGDRDNFKERNEARIENLIKSSDDFSEKFVVTASKPGLYPKEGIRIINKNPETGLIGGLVSAMKIADSPWLLVFTSLRPFFNREVADYLLEHVSSDFEAIIAVDRSGLHHPSCGIYNLNSQRILAEQIAGGSGLDRAIGLLKTKLVSLKHSIYPDEVLKTAETAERYARLRNAVNGPPIIAVSGVKNSGKTTLLTRLIPILRSKGLKVAVIKHDGHDFSPDVPGTDSYRLREAGAEMVAVYSSERYLLNVSRPDFSIDLISRQMADIDLVLYEGGKYTDYPKIEIVRRGVSKKNVSRADTILGLCTDTDLNLERVPSIALNDYETVAKIILDYLSRA